jgi:electron transfer flavoprotein alpha subunit
MGALVIAEHDNHAVKGGTLNAVTAAAKCGGDVTVLVAGAGCADAARAAAAIAGVSKVLVADAPHLGEQLAEAVAEQVLAVAAGFSHVLAPATAFGKNVLPRVAARLDVAQISDVTAVESPDTFQRPIYAGNAIATVQSSDAVKVMTVRTTAFDAAPATGGSATVEAVAAAADPGLSSFVGREVARSDKLGAAMGASRAAVDAGYAPNDWQVGQTGKIVAPQLYVAIGISGAIQHLAGMKDSKVIVAINKDAEAPIFGVADYGLVGDLFQAVPEMAGKL